MDTAPGHAMQTAMIPTATGNLDLASLAAAVAGLAAVHDPAEKAFLGIASALEEASGVLGSLQVSFTDLVERLEGSETASTTKRLREATRQIAALTEGEHGSTEVLAGLGALVKQIEGRLLALSKVLNEVGALAINAKIQASQTASGGIDFSVFTTEIHRLGLLAKQTLDQICIRLMTLDRTIGDALTGERDFERHAARELATVQGRLATGLDILADRRKRSAMAVEKVGLLSRDTAQRVVACMTELQFNDTASQRIEHVRDAIGIVSDLARSGDEVQIVALIGGVCRLQAMQLTRTGAEYQERVEILIANLGELAEVALKILSDTDGAIADGNSPGHQDDHHSFIGGLESDIALAAKLLKDQAVVRKRVKDIVQSVSTGLASMAADLEAIHSIDADMRVMGLNATFKCGRLGDKGRALGVIAHELRACSKRTEEFSAQISRLLQSAFEMSKSLGNQDDHDAGSVSRLETEMNDSLADLGPLAGSLDQALDRLHRDGEKVAKLLGDTAGKIDVHRQMHATLTRASEKLAEIADKTGVDDSGIAAVGERLRTLLAGHYTMQSERLIHQLVADCFVEDHTPPPVKPSGSDVNIDDLLF